MDAMGSRNPSCRAAAAGLSSALAILLAIGCGDGGPGGAPPKGGDPKTPSLHEASWPMCRGGPGLLGVAEGSLPDALALRWRFKTGDAIKSSPVIGGGRVFVGSDDEHVYAIDLEGGTKVWAFKTDNTVEAPPLLVGDKVFVGSSDGFLYALDAATGDLKWKYETPDRILGSANWTRSPQGDRVWILVGGYDSKLHAVDAETGEGVWTYETGNYINGSPAVADGKAIFGGCDARLHVVAVADGKQKADVDTGAYVAASPAVVEGRAYVGNFGNEFLCADLESRKILWRHKDREFPIYSSAAVAGDLVLFGSRDMRLHAVRRDTGAPVWTFDTRGEVNSSPVVCGDKVVVGSDDGRLYVVSLSDGRERWSYEIGQPVAGSPAVAAGLIVIGADDGCVYAFGAKP